MRRNVAHLTQAERQAYAQALHDVDLQKYIEDGVSYWDKQDQIHEGTHNHNGNSFLPWHRELVKRFERLVQQVNPDMALHYWDWTQDPRAADNGQGGVGQPLHRRHLRHRQRHGRGHARVAAQWRRRQRCQT